MSVGVLEVATDAPESDGTLAWDSTTIVVVEVEAGETTGLGWTYGDAAAAQVIAETLEPALIGREACDVPAAWMAMRETLRNSGTRGIGALAISAVDIALWDRLAREAGLPLAVVLGAYRRVVPAYGSGGFCSYDDDRLARQLGDWVASGAGAVKMKVGRDPDRDLERVRVARDAIGPDVALFVDANGAYARREAIAWTHRFAESAAVSWMEEPVSSGDRAGLRMVREQAPPEVAIAAGEYAWGPEDARDLLADETVDVLQADATRCLGLTGFRSIAGLASARGIALSAHCSPAIHLHACCAVERLAHLEYFHDHVRLESMIFDGLPELADGLLRINPAAPGHGLSLRPGTISMS